MSIISPIIPTYSSQAPYLTAAEFLASPTALEVTDLIPGGTDAQQTAVLANTVLRASSWIDSLAEQTLAATVDVDRGRFRVGRCGVIRMPLRYKPMLEVRSVSVGRDQASMTPLTDLSVVTIMPRGTIEIALSSFTFGTSTFGVGSRPLVDVGYVNGWVNTLTSAGSAAGASTLLLTSVLGVYAGTVVTLYDDDLTESVTVLSVSGSTVTLTAPLLHAHASGISVSNLPASVKQIAVLLTSVLIRTRGDDAIVLDSTDTPMRGTSMAKAISNDIDLAKAMLGDLTRAW